MTDLSVPVSRFKLSANLPQVVRSCIIEQPVPPDPAPGELDQDVWLPVAPGVTYENLPDPPTIIDTSPTDLIGCIENTGNNPQLSLNDLFPSAVSGDGVLERISSHIWVFNGTTWNDVGSNPGPTVVVDTVIPFWNERVLTVARTRTSVVVAAFNYALQLSTEAIIKTVTNIDVSFAKTLSVPGPIRINISAPVPSIEAVSTQPRYFQIVNGYAPPVLGSTQVASPSSATGDGWTLLADDTYDDSSFEITGLPFFFTLNGIAYNSMFVESNNYITFGGIFDTYYDYSATRPPYPKIMIGATDLSLQRLYVKIEDNIVRIRCENNSNYSAPAGNSDRFMEIMFHKPLEDGTQHVEVRTGNIAGDTSGLFIVATANTSLASGTFDANQSWVITGNSTGTSWVIESGKYIEISDPNNIVENFGLFTSPVSDWSEYAASIYLNGIVYTQSTTVKAATTAIMQDGDYATYAQTLNAVYQYPYYQTVAWIRADLGEDTPIDRVIAAVPISLFAPGGALYQSGNTNTVNYKIQLQTSSGTLIDAPLEGGTSFFTPSDSEEKEYKFTSPISARYVFIKSTQNSGISYYLPVVLSEFYALSPGQAWNLPSSIISSPFIVYTISGEATKVDGNTTLRLGNTAADPSAAASDGWTLVYDGYTDSLDFAITGLAFDVRINNTAYNSIYVFGDNISSFGTNVDRFSQPRLYHAQSFYTRLRKLYKKQTSTYLYIRTESVDQYGSPGSTPTFFVEAALYKATDEGLQYIEVRAGTVRDAGSAISLRTLGSTYADTTDIANKTYVMTGNSAGTAWTLESGKHIEL